MDDEVSLGLLKRHLFLLQSIVLKWDLLKKREIAHVIYCLSETTFLFPFTAGLEAPNSSCTSAGG